MNRKKDKPAMRSDTGWERRESTGSSSIGGPPSTTVPSGTPSPSTVTSEASLYLRDHAQANLQQLKDIVPFETFLNRTAKSTVASQKNIDQKSTVASRERIDRPARMAEGDENTRPVLPTVSHRLGSIHSPTVSHDAGAVPTSTLSRGSITSPIVRLSLPPPRSGQRSQSRAIREDADTVVLPGDRDTVVGSMDEMDGVESLFGSETEEATVESREDELPQPTVSPRAHSALVSTTATQEDTVADGSAIDTRDTVATATIDTGRGEEAEPATAAEELPSTDSMQEQKKKRKRKRKSGNARRRSKKEENAKEEEEENGENKNDREVAAPLPLSPTAADAAQERRRSTRARTPAVPATTTRATAKGTVASGPPIDRRRSSTTRQAAPAAAVAKAALSQNSVKKEEKKGGGRGGRKTGKRMEKEKAPAVPVKPMTPEERTTILAAYAKSPLYQRLLDGQSKAGVARMQREGEQLKVVDFEIDKEIFTRGDEGLEQWDKQEVLLKTTAFTIDFIVLCSRRSLGSEDVPYVVLAKFDKFPVPNWTEGRLIKKGALLRGYIRRNRMLDLVESMARLEEGDEFDIKYPNRYSEWEDGVGVGGYIENEHSLAITHLRGVEYRWNIVNEAGNVPMLLLEDWTGLPRDDAALKKIQYSNYLVMDEDVKRRLGDRMLMNEFVCKSCCKACGLSARTKEVRACCNMTVSHDLDANGQPMLIENGVRAEPAKYFLRIECSAECECERAKCRNRDCQNGRPYILVIFRTRDKDWTVRTTCEIPAGAFVSEYTGRVRLRPSTGPARAYDCSMSYGMKTERGRTLRPFTIAAYETANESRFFAHSCEPNMELHVSIVERYGLHYSRAAFYATRKILAGEELTFDYLSEREELDCFTFFPFCVCRSVNCRYPKEKMDKLKADLMKVKEEEEDEIASAETPAERQPIDGDEVKREQKSVVVRSDVVVKIEVEEEEEGGDGLLLQQPQQSQRAAPAAPARAKSTNQRGMKRAMKGGDASMDDLGSGRVVKKEKTEENGEGEKEKKKDDGRTSDTHAAPKLSPRDRHPVGTPAADAAPPAASREKRSSKEFFRFSPSH